MNDLIDSAAVDRRAAWMHAVPVADFLPVPDGPGSPLQPGGDLFSRVLEQVGHGIMVVTAQGRPVFANRAALRACGHGAPLRLERGVVRAVRAADAAVLARSMQQAVLGRRSMLTFDAVETESRFLAIIPLSANDVATCEDASTAVAVLIFGRPQMCDPLSIECFARQHGMTLAESAVLTALCSGLVPRRIAEQRGVAVSTVRTHVMRILEKSGARTITDLLRVAAMLPPLVTLAA
jgi:DNA-binding CsgD family transcriptional regulator